MKIALIGSGNIATQLGDALLKAGHSIESVFSKDLSHATLLAKKLHAIPLKNIGEISKKADLILIAVNDDAIEKVAAQLKKVSAIVAHTSGSVSLEVLKKYCKRCGVFYPLQTINKNRKVDFQNVPICVEANSKAVQGKLVEIASSISTNIYKLNSEQRLAAHVAAVFANNFSNYVMNVAEEILNDNNLPFDLLRPLISATAKKVQIALPSEIQTGPAKRNDQKTIKKHLLFLKNDVELSKIYKLLSASIQKKNKK